jgi:alkyl hydroperoxide reductase subunit AhpC
VGYLGRSPGYFYSLEAADAEAVKADDAVGEGLAFKSRTVFIIDDKKRFRLIFNYPAAVGINTAEVLRVIDCLQTAAHAEYVHVLARSPGFIC